MTLKWERTNAYKANRGSFDEAQGQLGERSTTGERIWKGERWTSPLSVCRKLSPAAHTALRFESLLEVTQIEQPQKDLISENRLQISIDRRLDEELSHLSAASITDQ